MPLAPDWTGTGLLIRSVGVRVPRAAPARARPCSAVVSPASPKWQGRRLLTVTVLVRVQPPEQHTPAQYSGNRPGDRGVRGVHGGLWSRRFGFESRRSPYPPLPGGTCPRSSAERARRSERRGRWFDPSRGHFGSAMVSWRSRWSGPSAKRVKVRFDSGRGLPRHPLCSHRRRAWVPSCLS